MLWVPLIVSIVVAVTVAPGLVRELKERRLVRVNCRGVEVPVPTGILVPLTAILAFGPLVVVSLLLPGEELFQPFTGAVFLYVLGVGFLGLIDDLLGSGRTPDDDSELPRGWRGHGRAIGSGRISTGAYKAVGALALALVTLAGVAGDTVVGYLIATVLLVLTTNLFNLFDTGPGRSLKLFVVIGIGLLIGAGGYLAPVWGLGIFIAPILVLIPYDLRERGMLGDTGANAIGAVAGLWMVSTLSVVAQAVALAVVIAISLYGEFRSIAKLIERTPGLRQLDSAGRAHA